MPHQRIRVLNVLPLGTMGGAENFVLSLCRNHDQRRFHPSVAVLFSDGVVSEQIAAEGYPVTALDMANGFDMARAMKLVSLIRRNRIDIVNIHGQNPLGKLFSILGRPRAIVHTDHGTSVNAAIKRRSRVVLFNRFLTPFIHRFVAISEDMKYSLRTREKVPERKIELIHNGVDIHTNSDGSVDLKQFRQGLGIPENLPVLGYIGRLAIEKQLPLLLDALSILNNQGVEFMLLLIGEGPEKDRLASQVSRLGLDRSVQFLGQRHDVSRLLKLIDVLAFPSGGEAFPITVLEAMAQSTPVVAFNVAGVREAVVDQQTGFLAPFGDVKSFAAKLKHLIQSPELSNKMGSSALERVRTKFDLKMCVSKLEGLYENLISSNARK